MKSKYKPYSSYRDSGVRWLGDIPESWKVIKTAYLFSSAMGQTILKEDLIDDGRYPVYSATAEDKFFGYVNYATVKLKKNDIVIPARGNSIGFVKLVKDNATTTQTTIYCKPLTQRTNPKYVYYYMLGLKPHLFYFVQTAIPQITVSEVLSNPLLLPPFQDQQTIANYLDSATAKIDTLIEKQTRLIALLKEKRQAVISTAVTRGLDNTVAMKDSGVEWLGEIPEHWTRTPLRYIGRLQNGISKGGDYFGSGYPFVNYGDIYKNATLPQQVSGLAKSTKEDQHIYSVKTGDVFFTRTSETIDDIGMASTCIKTIKKGTFSGFTIRFRQLSQTLNEHFSKYYFRTGHAQAFFEEQLNLVTRASLGQDILKQLPVLLPPLDEQQVIANYLDDKISKIDILITKATKAIELLKEKRTALINSAVTGKIDVRESE